MHEDFSRQEDIKPSSDRSFGLMIATVFLAVTFWPLIHAEPVRWWALAVAAVFAVLALMWTAALAPLNKWWTKLGVLLYRVVSPIVLGLLFYVAVMPVGLLMRALGKVRCDCAATPMPRVIGSTERRRGPHLNP